jgi:DNA helicase HerA-like ATPase
VVRLIRSKGVGIYFITQNPMDIPENVLGQLGMKVQHALRAFTPKDQKTIRAVAASFVANPDFDTAAAVTDVGIGEALVSVLDDTGRPQPVQRTLISPPEGQIGPLAETDRAALVQRSPIRGRYDMAMDRESAHELLKARADIDKARRDQQQAELEAARLRQEKERASRRASGGSRRQSTGEAMMKSAARAIGSQIGRQIIRGVLGSIFGKR